MHKTVMSQHKTCTRYPGKSSLEFKSHRNTFTLQADLPYMEVSGRTQGSRVQLGLKLGVEIGYINLRQHRADEVFIQTWYHDRGGATYAPRGSLDLECMQEALERGFVLSFSGDCKGGRRDGERVELRRSGWLGFELEARRRGRRWLLNGASGPRGR